MASASTDTYTTRPAAAAAMVAFASLRGPVLLAGTAAASLPRLH